MNMIEQVAEAIFNTLCPGIRYLDNDKACYQEAAKAAIEAMRHPTIEMIEAGCNAHPNSYGPGLHPAVYQYRTMIDTALKE